VLIAVWAVTPSWSGADGLDEAFSLESSDDKNDDGPGQGFGHGAFACIAAVNATVSLWSTLLLNVADLSRLAPRQRDQIVGQLVGVPVPQLFAYAVGILGASAVQAKSGRASWLITDLFVYWPAWAALLGGIVVMLTLVAVNVGANIMPPANDFMNLEPDRFSFRGCAYATIALSVCICPWYVFHSASSFALRFIDGYGMVTGAMYGLMVSDYFVVRRGELGMTDLYPAHGSPGACAYWNGHNWRAALAMFAGVSLPAPGWTAHLIGAGVPHFWVACHEASWFISSGVAAAIYLTACWLSPPAMMHVQSQKRPKDHGEVNESAKE
jgi:NCS1 family nucleobase:cation symporter-1